MGNLYRIESSALSEFDAAVLRFDTNMVMTNLNRAAERLLGVTEHDKITLPSLFPDERDFARVSEEWNHRMSGRASAYRTKFTPPGRPRTKIPVSVYGFPESNEAGIIVGSIVILRDLREDVARDRIYRAIEASTDNAALLGEVTAALRELIDFDVMRVSVVSSNRRHLRTLFSTDLEARSKFPFRWWPMPAMVQHVLSRTEPRLRSVQELREEFADLLRTDKATKRFLLDSNIEQVITVPVLQDNRVIAFLGLDASRTGCFDQDTLELLKRLPVVNAVTAAVNRESGDRQEAVINLLRMLAGIAGDVQAVCDEMVKHLQKSFPWDRVGLYKYQDGDAGLLRVSEAHVHEFEPMAPVLDLIDPRGAICRNSGAENSPRLANVSDLSIEEYRPWAGPLRRQGMNSMLAVAMPARTVQWLLTVESRQSDAFASDEIEALEALTAEAGSILYHAALFERQRAVLSAISDIVIETHEHGRIRWVNSAAHRLLGVTRDAVDRGLSLGDLLVEPPAREIVERESRWEGLETQMFRVKGAPLPVLLSFAPLPPPLSGRVFVASDFTVQKELLRLHDFKEVFRYAAMEGRVPLALAATWLQKCSRDSALREGATRVMRLLARADLPLERLMRMFAEENSAPTYTWCELQDAVSTTLTEFPQELACQVRREQPEAKLQVRAPFEDVQFCIESLLGFGLRTKPQARELLLSTTATDHEAVLRVHGDWTVSPTSSAQSLDATSRWQRKSMTDLGLGQGVLERLIGRAGGKVSCVFHPRLDLEIRLPLND